MYTYRFFKPKLLLSFFIGKIIKFTIYASIVVAAYYFFEWQWLKVPWVPLTLIGIAVAFYLGFKNNSAYDRTWEARKIWGGIVNASRSWGTMVRAYITDEFTDESITEEDLDIIRKRVTYRHIAWLYRLKRQLRVPKEWEHNLKFNTHYRKNVIAKYFPQEDPEKELQNFLEDAEVQEILSRKNACTHLIDKQAQELKELKRRGLIDDFRHMEMQKMLNDFYTLQGKCERIKNFPLPRQYASISIYLVYIFIFLLPMGLLSAFDDANMEGYMIWGTVPFTVLIAWIFWMMESVGDYAENPFEYLAFDTPMDSLTRTIEIDLREMLGEKEIPKPITPQDHFVM